MSAATGAVVPGADVLIANIATNETQNITTSENGVYVMPQLKPGLYRITVKKPGFKAASVEEVKLDVAQIREIDQV
ncbi:MAG: carboxypeptidase regulatory-like domain-containing protein [Acidobacteria bacterium]|nr:carboxypeptidase regulatory-like domain-containing protein [Acidobacteriota bacterium]